MKVLALLLAVAAPAAAALSCMCVSYDPTNAAEMRSLIARSDLVATVVIEDVTEVTKFVFEARATVEETVKGSTGDAVSLVQRFDGPCYCDPRMIPQQRYLVFLSIDAEGTRQSGPIIAFPDAERFLSQLRAIVEGS